MGNLALLLPSRDAWATALAVVGLFAYLRRIEARLRLEYSMRTWEGRAARALIFTPWLILLGRRWLHGADWLYLAACCSLAAFVLIWEMKRYAQSPWVVLVGEALGRILAAFAWIQVFTALNRYFDYGLPGSGFVRPLGWRGLGLATQVRYGASAYRILSGGGVLIALLFDEGASWPLLLAGIVWTAAGIRYRERYTMLVGATALVAGTVNYLIALVRLYAQAPLGVVSGVGFCHHRLGFMAGKAPFGIVAASEETLPGKLAFLVPGLAWNKGGREALFLLSRHLCFVDNNVYLARTDHPEWRRVLPDIKPIER
ncbi:MAG: hypothetical protein ACK4JF_02685 [Methylohalobius sp.]